MSSDTISLTTTQLNAILAAQIGIFVAGTLLFTLCLFNIWKYLIVKKRYKDVNDLFFYINAVIIILTFLYSTA